MSYLIRRDLTERGLIGHFLIEAGVTLNKRHARKEAIMSQAQPIIIESDRLDLPPIENSVPSVQAGRHLSSRARATSNFILGALLVLLPLMFGAVHPIVALPARMITLALLSFFLLRYRARVEECFASQTWARALIYGGLLFLAYALLQGMTRILASEAHPILGTTSGLASNERFLSACADIFFFLCSFAAFRTAIGRNRHNANRLTNMMLLAGLAVSLTALTHWFYDNGKLFWAFEPDHVFVSPRARWPFVNSNNLAQYLLLTIFILLAGIAAGAVQLADAARSVPKHAKRSLALLVLNRGLQKYALRSCFLVVFLGAALLAITGSLSRAGWLGLAVGLVLLVARSLYLAPLTLWLRRDVPRSPTVRSPGMNEIAFSEMGARRRSRSHRGSGATKATGEKVEAFLESLSGFSKPIIALIALFALVFFLRGRGTELLASRLDYGLAYSQDDIRWQLYKDSLEMIRDHLLTGVGIGQWAEYYPAYMSPLLSGVDPVYLHSDPLQLLSESGVIGFSLLAALVLLLLRDALRAARRAEHANQRIIVALTCGSVALITASIFDFPFRIPAIVATFSAYLALLSFYVDEANSAAEPASGETLDL